MRLACALSFLPITSRPCCSYADWGTLPSCPRGSFLRPDLYPTETRSTGHAVSNSFARCGAIGASYWVASGVSNEGLALLILVVGVVGGITGQV